MKRIELENAYKKGFKKPLKFFFQNRFSILSHKSAPMFKIGVKRILEYLFSVCLEVVQISKKPRGSQP